MEEYAKTQLISKLMSDFAETLAKVEERGRGERSADTPHFVYLASKARILTAADTLMRSELLGDPIYESECPEVIAIPTQETWNLKMGDSVLVEYSLENFKSISKRTVGWNPKYSNVLSQVGIITSICSKYDCHVQVLFPDLPMMTEIYAGLLSQTSEVPKAFKSTRFKFGDKVAVEAPIALVQLLQRKYERLPERFLNKTGEVIAVDCHNAVYVTFTGTFVCKVNPALLKNTEGQLEIVQPSNAKSIAPDDKVVVTSNLKKLIAAQKKIHEWERWMSKLTGKSLRVLLVKKDGLLRVCDDAGRSFNIHTDVVAPVGKVQDEGGEDVQFAVGEWVAIKKIAGLKEILEEKKIPFTILEFLQHPAMIVSYNDDLDPGITFDFIYTITIPASALDNLTSEENENAKQLAFEAKLLRPGDEVCLNLGPPNYVREILLEQKVSDSILDIITSKTYLRGFIGTKNAVIECCDGKLRKINRVYLTVPRKFRSPVKDKLCDELSHVNVITSIVEKCLEELNKKELSTKLHIESGIQTVCLGNGKPSTVRIGIRSHFADSGSLTAALQKSESLKFKLLGEGFLKVWQVNSSPAELLVRLDFDNVVAFPIKVTEEGAQTMGAEKLHVSEPGSTAEAVKATPGPRVEPPTVDQAGYEHLETTLGGMRIQIPYRIAETQQPPPPAERQVASAETGDIATRITIDGRICNIHIE